MSDSKEQTIGKKSHLLTRDALLKGDAYGTHIVSGNPLTAHKKVNCEVKVSSRWFPIFSGIKHEKCIAKLEVPTEATVIRALVIDKYHMTETVSNKLRTDVYKVLDISPLQESKTQNKEVVRASSVHKKSFSYETGKTYREELDKDEYEPCTSGLHFFLNRSEAEDYAI